MKTGIRRQWLLSLACALLLVVSSCEPDDQPAQVNVEDVPAIPLADLIMSLPTWRQSRDDFLPAEKAAYIAAARRMQHESPEQIEAALQEVPKRCSKEQFNGDYEAESRPYLLLRIAFEVPEQYPLQQVRSFKGWIGRPQVNLSWPVRWRGESFELVTRYEGSTGPAYLPLLEYQYFKDRFRHRLLPPQPRVEGASAQSERS